MIHRQTREEAWNAHDLHRILSHDSDDVERSSPLIVERLSYPESVLKGKAAVREYWRPSLSLDPPLQFELKDDLVGVAHVTLYWRRIVAEMLCINSSGKVNRGIAQWPVIGK